MLFMEPQPVHIALVCKASTRLQESLAPGEVSRWGEAVGNIENARVALHTLARAIEDAVYLDEDAYTQVAPVMQYQRTMQVLRHACCHLLLCSTIYCAELPTMVPCLAMLQIQQQRVTELTLELQETNNNLDECRAQKGAADQRITEMAQELENSAGCMTSAHVYHVTCLLC